MASVTVTERTLDKKRRVVIPSNVGSLKGRSKITMITRNDDAVIIASDKDVAQQISKVLEEAEVKSKLRALGEWEALVEKAGLANLTAEKIDRAVAEGIRRPKKLNV